jgi:hypothetical protein
VTHELVQHEDVIKGPVCGCLMILRRNLRSTGWKPAEEHRTGSAILYVQRLPEGPITRTPVIVASFCPLCGEAYA